MTKILKEEQISELDIYNFEGDFNTMINRLQSLKEANSNWINAKIKIVNDYEGAPKFCIYGSRLETDKEYQYRLKQEEKNQKAALKRAATIEKQEKLQYEKLKKRYG